MPMILTTASPSKCSCD